MSRQSCNVETESGRVVDGFDYALQVWVVDGIVQRCGHPESMGPNCCNGRKWAGVRVDCIPGHQGGSFKLKTAAALRVQDLARQVQRRD